MKSVRLPSVRYSVVETDGMMVLRYQARAKAKWVVLCRSLDVEVIEEVAKWHRWNCAVPAGMGVPQEAD